MNIQLTAGEAQALADLIDREVRMNGGQAAATYGPLLRQMIEAAQAEQKESQDGDADTDD